jgi:nucleoside-diphosphate-sugar epimerase
MKFTVLGSKGFIGSHIVKYLKEQNIDYFTPEIRKQSLFEGSLGHVIYAIGITADFREKPFDTVDAHVCNLKNFFKQAKFDSFMYLSSTRVYSESYSTNEDDPLTVKPLQTDNLYNISKIMGESLCMTLNNPNVRVVRLSNVFGTNFHSSNFLFSIIRDAVEKNKVILNTTFESEKDYVYIDDVIKVLPEISLKGKHRIYNVASGQNTKVKDIIRVLSNITNCTVEQSNKAINHFFPLININRIKSEFSFNPISLLSKLESLVHTYRKQITYDSN